MTEGERARMTTAYILHVAHILYFSFFQVKSLPLAGALPKRSPKPMVASVLRRMRAAS
jgi:hypothetical protein